VSTLAWSGVTGITVPERKANGNVSKPKATHANPNHKKRFLVNIRPRFGRTHWSRRN